MEEGIQGDSFGCLRGDGFTAVRVGFPVGESRFSRWIASLYLKLFIDNVVLFC